MIIKKLSTLLLMCALFGPMLHGMTGRLNVRGRSVITNDTNAARTLANQELVALSGLRSKKAPSLAEVHRILKNFQSARFLKESIRNQFQKLQNLVHTIVSDVPESYISEKLDPQFTMNVLDLLEACCELAKPGCPNKEKKGKEVHTSTKACNKDAKFFLIDYSESLSGTVEDLHRAYCETVDCVTQSKNSLEDAKKSLVSGQRKASKAHKVFTQAKNRAATLRTKAKKAKDKFFSCIALKSGVTNRNRLRTLNLDIDAQKRVQNKCEAAYKKAKAFRDGKYELRTQANNQVKKAQRVRVSCRKKITRPTQLCDTAFKSLTDALKDFDRKNIRLLNNSACVTSKTLGKLPCDLVLSIFRMFERNESLNSLVDHGLELIDQNNKFYAEFILTLQHYICRAYSQDKYTAVSAKGFSWELAVGLFLYENLQDAGDHTFESFGKRLPVDSNDARDFDITTSELLIECKNIGWKELKRTYQKQFIDQRKIAFKDRNRLYVIISKKAVPQSVATWFEENSILFIDPNNAEANAGSVQYLLNNGKKSLSDLFKDSQGF